MKQAKNSISCIFSWRLKHLMVIQGKTQAQVADAIGVTQPMIGRYLKGVVPEGEKVWRLSLVFGVPVEMFFTSRDEHRERGAKDVALAEGIAQHDKGDFENQVRKFNEVMVAWSKLRHDILKAMDDFAQNLNNPTAPSKPLEKKDVG